MSKTFKRKILEVKELFYVKDYGHIPLDDLDYLRLPYEVKPDGIISITLPIDWFFYLVVDGELKRSLLCNSKDVVLASYYEPEAILKLDINYNNNNTCIMVTLDIDNVPLFDFEKMGVIVTYANGGKVDLQFPDDATCVLGQDKAIVTIFSEHNKRLIGFSNGELWEISESGGLSKICFSNGEAK